MALLELAGALKHDPKRYADRREPKPSGPLGDPPKRLRRAEKAMWAELVSIIPEGVLGNSDRWLVEITSRLMAKMVKNGIGGAVGLTGSELSQLSTLLGRMGMTPSDRSKVGVPLPQRKTEKQINRFADLDSGGAPVQ
jgi:hypothetical protein